MAFEVLRHDPDGAGRCRDFRKGIVEFIADFTVGRGHLDDDLADRRVGEPGDQATNAASVSVDGPLGQSL